MVLTCEGRIYDRAEIEPGTLQGDLDAGREPMARMLAGFESCKAFGPIEKFSHLDSDFKLDFVFDYSNPGMAMVNVAVCSAFDASACTHVKRAFLPDEKKAFADSSGRYTLMTRCEPKASCF